MNVRWFLDVSSGHLSPESWAWLDAQTADQVVRAPVNPCAEILGGRTRHGWFVHAIEAPAVPMPADLAAVLRRARQQECEYVLFDVDAPPTAELPILHPGFPGALVPD